LNAASNEKDRIEQEDVEAARDKVLLGLERDSLSLTEKEYRLLAYHEGGHTIVALTVPNADPIHKVTIVPRGKAMGVTQQLPERDKYIFTREYLIDRLTVMMGGRAAEQVVFETSTSGAENDLKEATRLARKMVLDWGMSERFKQIAFGGRREHIFLGEEIAQGRDYSDLTARDVDEEINKILDKVYQRAIGIIANKREGLDRLADQLLEHEELSGKEVAEIVQDKEAVQV
jgi:cell division protease FtsH